jgi:IS5 family transposase
VGKIGQGKRRFGLGLIREKLTATQGSTIAINVLAMNLQKLLDLRFVLVRIGSILCSAINHGRVHDSGA